MECEAGQHGLAVLGERPGREVVHVEQTLDFVADDDRRRHHGHDPFGPHDGVVVASELRVLRLVVGPDRAAERPDEPAEPLALLDPEVLERAGESFGSAVAHDHYIRIWVAQRDLGTVALQEIAGGLDRLPENRVEVQRRTERPRELHQRLRLAAPLLDVAVQTRVSDRHSGLSDEAVQQLLSVGVEYERPRADEGEDAEQRLAVDNGYGQNAAERGRHEPLSLDGSRVNDRVW